MIQDTFDTACAKLAGLLERSGHPTELLWICREDVTGVQRRLFVHPSPPAENRELYRLYYELGLERALGIRLEVLCFAAGRAYGYVWIPEDPLDASRAMLTSESLRLGFTIERGELPKGFPATRSWCRASFLLRRKWCRVQGESPAIEEIPTRALLEENARARNGRFG